MGSCPPVSEVVTETEKPESEEEDNNVEDGTKCDKLEDQHSKLLKSGKEIICGKNVEPDGHKKTEQILTNDERQRKSEKDSVESENYSDTTEAISIDKAKMAQSEKPCTDLSTDQKTRCDVKQFEEFLGKHGLSDLFREKIKLQDVLKIIDKRQKTDYKEVAFSFMRNLIRTNFKCRGELLFEDFSHLEHQPNNDVSCIDYGSINYYLDNILSNSSASVQSKNPLDLIVALFKCSSNMLQQILADKLFQCKLAIPFVFPPETKTKQPMISFWPLRSILLGGYGLGAYAIDCESHVISFARFGRPPISKSKFLNSVICDTSHDIFMHCDSPLGMSERHISEGLIETMWDLSSYKTSNPTDVKMYMNLRGNAEDSFGQLKILSHISSVMVIIVSFNDFKKSQFRKTISNLLKNKTDIILSIDIHNERNEIVRSELKEYFESDEEYKKRIKINILSNQRHDRNLCTIKSEILNIINGLLKCKTTESIKNRIQSLDGSLYVLDERERIFEKTQKQAESVFKFLDENNPSLKETILPLQGETWKRWSEQQKRKYRMHNCNVKQDDEIDQQLKKERQNQQSKCKLLNPMIKNFISILTDLYTAEDECDTFLLWLKYLLDHRCRQLLPDVISKCKDKTRELKHAKEENDIKSMQTLTDCVKKCRIDRENVNIGLEHFFREIGQLYEALTTLEIVKDKKLQKLSKQLPCLVATLLLRGYSSEIMDGAATNVPLSWVKAVLTELQQLTGDKKVLAISIVGIQSSGKSTLVNTMFGLQFAVSAGRCTKGVFMQLIQVEDPYLKCDYGLVFDTEGLRSTELGHTQVDVFSRDNELATFVIGVSDIAIINIKGENPVEIKDILQVVAHAFLRLKLANENLLLTQACVFIHQNVSALDNDIKVAEGRRVFIETLDEMTKLAANQEDILDIHSFKQVINFDEDENVLYFPDLWQWPLPMSLVNSSYVQKATMLRHALLHQLTPSEKSCLQISNFFHRIDDLWLGILKDDFVFQFRNTIESKAYTLLEKEYQLKCLELEMYALKYKKKEATVILTGSRDTAEWETKINIINKTFDLEMQKNVSILEEELKIFVDKSDLKEYMNQWKQTKLQGLRETSRLVLSAQKDQIGKLKGKLMLEEEIKKERIKVEKEVHESCEQLSSKLQGRNLNDVQKREEFDDMWGKFMERLNSKGRTDQDKCSTEQKIIESLIELSPSDSLFFKESKHVKPFEFYQALKQLKGSIAKEEIPLSKLHSVRDSLTQLIPGNSNSGSSISEQAVNVIDDIFIMVDDRVNELPQISLADCKDIFRIASSIFHSQSKKIGRNFSILPPLKAMILKHIARYLSVVDERLRGNTNKIIKDHVENSKEHVFDIFKHRLRGYEADAMASCHFRNAIVENVIKHVNRLISVDVIEIILKHFSCSKEILMKHILRHLLNIEPNDHQQIMEYISQPYDFAKSWITHYTFQEIFDKDNKDMQELKKLANRHINKIFDMIKVSVNSANYGCVQDSQMHNIQTWLEYFINSIKGSTMLPVSTQDFAHVQIENVSIENFSNSVLGDISTMIDQVCEAFTNQNASTFVWDENPIPMIVDNLWGCPEKCKFCFEPCMRSDKNHWNEKVRHKCIQHRPQALGRWRSIQDKRLSLQCCNILVQTKEVYRKHEKKCYYKRLVNDLPDWDIPPSNETPIYWKRIICKYKAIIEKEYKAFFEHIPDSWYEIKDFNAQKSLFLSHRDCQQKRENPGAVH